MKFFIDEFEIEESRGRGEQEQDTIKQILQDCVDEERKKRIYNAMHGDDILVYRIRKEQTENSESVGEVSFRGIGAGKPEIGVYIEEEFRGQGIAYRVIVALMNRLHKDQGINSFIYNVLSNNIASKRLVEKLGGELIKSVDLIKEFDISCLTYRILL